MTDTVPVPFPAPGSQARNFAGMAQLFGCLGWISVLGAIACPLVLYFIKRDEEPFVAFHALQATLFQVITLGVVVVVVPLVVMTCVLIPLLPVGLLAWLFFCILGTTAAFRGQWARYPLVGQWALDHVIARHAARVGSPS